MTNSQEYTLHVLNELMVASYASHKNRTTDGVPNTSDLALAVRLRAEISALHGCAADSNSIVAAAFSAMRINVSGAAEDVDQNALRVRIDSALADDRLPEGLRETLARFSEGTRRDSATPM